MSEGFNSVISAFKRQRYTLSFSCLFELVYLSMSIRVYLFELAYSLELGSEHEFEIELITDVVFDSTSPSCAANLGTKKGQITISYLPPFRRDTFSESISSRPVLHNNVFHVFYTQKLINPK